MAEAAIDPFSTLNNHKDILLLESYIRLFTNTHLDNLIEQSNKALRYKSIQIGLFLSFRALESVS